MFWTKELLLYSIRVIMAKKQKTKSKDRTRFEAPELEKMYTRVRKDLRRIGLPLGQVTEVGINMHLRTSLGRCCSSTKNGERVCRLEFNRTLFRFPTDAAFQDTMAHELIHTIPGCQNHGHLFKEYCSTINERLEGYNVRPKFNYEDYGVLNPHQKTSEFDFKYILICEKCGQVFGRDRMSPFVKNPDDYRCPCGGRILRVM